MLFRLRTLAQGLLRCLGQRPASQPGQDDGTAWAALRSSQPGDDDLLGAPAQAWLDHLPQHAQPRRLAARHPRVVNRLADVWADSRAAADVIDTLMIDQRGGRTGFSPAIRAELMRLQYLQRKLASETARYGAAGADAPGPRPAQALPHARNNPHHSDA